MEETTTPAPETPGKDFIREIVEDDLRTGKHTTRRHALPARAERLPPHRPRQVDLPQLRRREGVRRHLQPPLRRHEPPQGGRRVRRRDRGGRPLARLRVERDVLRLGLLREDLRLRRGADPAREGLRLRPHGRRGPRDARHAHRAREEQPVPRPPRRGEPRPLPPDARRRVRRRLADPPGEDRHGLARTSTCATRRSTGSARRPTTGRATRGASTRCTTTPTPLSDWIEGITHSLCTLEFEDHRPLYDWCLVALGLENRPRQIEFARLDHHLHAPLEEEAPPARRRRARPGLGRPADADDRGAAAPRLHARGDPRLRRPDRPRQARQRRRRRAPRALPPGGPQPPRPARDGRPRPAEGRPDELARGERRGARGGEQPRGPVRPGRARSPSAASSASSGTTSARCRRRSTTASRPGRRCASAGASSSGARRS